MRIDIENLMQGADLKQMTASGKKSGDSQQQYGMFSDILKQLEKNVQTVPDVCNISVAESCSEDEIETEDQGESLLCSALNTQNEPTSANPLTISVKDLCDINRRISDKRDLSDTSSDKDSVICGMSVEMNYYVNELTDNVSDNENGADIQPVLFNEMPQVNKFRSVDKTDNVSDNENGADIQPVLFNQMPQTDKLRAADISSPDDMKNDNTNVLIKSKESDKQASENDTFVSSASKTQSKIPVDRVKNTVFDQIKTKTSKVPSYTSAVNNSNEQKSDYTETQASEQVTEKPERKIKSAESYSSVSFTSQSNALNKQTTEPLAESASIKSGNSDTKKVSANIDEVKVPDFKSNQAITDDAEYIQTEMLKAGINYYNTVIPQSDPLNNKDKNSTSEVQRKVTDKIYDVNSQSYMSKTQDSQNESKVYQNQPVNGKVSGSNDNSTVISQNKVSEYTKSGLSESEKTFEEAITANKNVSDEHMDTVRVAEAENMKVQTESVQQAGPGSVQPQTKFLNDVESEKSQIQKENSVGSEMVDSQTATVNSLEPKAVQPQIQKENSVGSEMVDPQTATVNSLEPEAVQPQIQKENSVGSEMVDSQTATVNSLEPEAVQPQIQKENSVGSEMVDSQTATVNSLEPEAVQPQIQKENSVGSEMVDPQTVTVKSVELESERPHIQTVNSEEPEMINSQTATLKSLESENPQIQTVNFEEAQKVNSQTQTVKSVVLESEKPQLQTVNSIESQMVKPQTAAVNSLESEAVQPQIQKENSIELEMINPQTATVNSVELESEKPQIQTVDSEESEMINPQTATVNSVELESEKPQIQTVNSEKSEMVNLQTQTVKSIESEKAETQTVNTKDPEVFSLPAEKQNVVNDIVADQKINQLNSKTDISDNILYENEEMSERFPDTEMIQEIQSNVIKTDPETIIQSVSDVHTQTYDKPLSDSRNILGLSDTITADKDITVPETENVISDMNYSDIHKNIVENIISDTNDELYNKNSEISSDNKIFDKKDQDSVENHDVQTDNIDRDKNAESISRTEYSDVEEIIHNTVILDRFSFAGRSEMLIDQNLTEKEISDQTLNALEKNIVNKKDEFIIKLTPEGLGDITVKLIRSDDEIVVKMIASNEKTSQLLNRELGILQHVLDHHNARIQTVEYHAPQQSFDNSRGGYNSMHYSSDPGSGTDNTEGRRNRQNYQNYQNLNNTQDEEEIVQTMPVIIGNTILNRYI